MGQMRLAAGLVLLLLAGEVPGQQFMPNRRRAFTAFSPASLSGLKFWLNNDSLAGNNGDQIGLWTNSAAVNGFTNGVSGAVPFLTNSVVNGRPAVAFDGINDSLLATGGLDALNNVGSSSVFVVSKRNTAASSRAVFCFWTGTSPVGNARLVPYTDATGFHVGGRRLDADSYLSSDSAGYPSGFVLFAVQPVWSSSDAYCWTNGVQAIADTTWGTAGNTSSTDSLGFSLATGTATEYWSGWIAELLVYVPALSDPDRQSVENYLRAKFALW